ncbi:hypothetical protein [Streptomyces sp. NBC_00576]|uniref:hypothetical protein n=1 Tax=Streptomyces sp. NBC_00576 TaxID=2903665 RepID=UPI002E80BE6C|nr:hypothetical protein [Streptomyces sp. NBC_00576]WUB73963.1 hypothetical protein OG734_30020 [Streptomyces sp. NBC_00576]
MSVWEPEPGEVLLARAPITFVTGEVTRVSGMRWFRDPQRNDIQDELAGWPVGRKYRARSTGSVIARNAIAGVLITAGVAVLAFLSAHGGNLGGPMERNKRTSRDRADEIDDFPVMWAAPGTIARTLPWQLDPGRSSEKRYGTHAVLTDRRLVIVGFPNIKGNAYRIDDEILWEIPRAAIERVELRDFKAAQDVKIFFTDGSWCRLRSVSRERLTRYFIEPLDFVPLDSLTPAQRKTAEDFAAAQAPDAELPLVQRNPCGCFRVEVLALSAVEALFGHSSRDMVMDVGGTELQLMEYHPEDLLS